jgi:CheY-like chemotaxis protein
MAVLAAMRSLPRKPPAIVQTAHGSIDAAIAAMRNGAADFVVKPVSPERLEVSIKNALKIEALADVLVRIKASTRGELGFADLIAGSEAMARVIELGNRAANSTIPVLIEGEQGVGKELIARAIQGESARKSKPFVTVNCGAIPETLVESILFGHDKCSFTGAPEKRTGKFLEADQGTLFLDEIGDRSRRREALGQGRFPPDRGDQSEPDRPRQSGPLPRGPLLPAERFPHLGAPLEGTARGRAGARPPFHREIRRRGGQAYRRHRRRGDCHAPALYLARQHPPA